MLIKFPSKINSLTFENTLQLWYLKSKAKQTTEIVFDFSSVDWCDIFEISLIALWILELQKIDKIITFTPPQNQRVRNFLAKYEFGKFLTDNNINNTISYSNIEGDFLISTAYFPLKFYNEGSFQNLLKYLSDNNNYFDAFSDIATSGIIKKEHLRNVIIQELGDNMYRHGLGKFANIIMAKYGITKEDIDSRTNWKSSLIRNASPFEKRFFEKLNGRDYFTIVVSDKGPGIFKTLRQSYPGRKDKSNFSECDILEYAFYSHSTSRTPNERLGELSEFYDVYRKAGSTRPILPPPTGLYVLLNIVREFNGLLFIRSGVSIISFDFYSDPYQTKPIRSDQITGFKKLANFGGTQIKIHFPINIDIPNAIFQRNRFLFPETKKHVQYKYISVLDFFSQINKGNDHEEKVSLYRVFEAIDEHKSLNQKTGASIILDLNEQISISTKAMYFLIAKLMESQTHNYAHVLINLSPYLVQTVKLSFLCH